MSIRPIKYINPQKFTVNGQTMGTWFSAVFFAEQDFDASQLANQLQAAVTKVDDQMSNWKPESDLSKFNAAPCNQWVNVPHDLLHVVDEGLEIGRNSNSAFDIGLGDVVNAWGFGPAQSTPNSQQINQLSIQQRPITFDHIQLDKAQNRLRKSAPIALDLCGIAKGYGADKLAHCLNDAGIQDYLVSIDGEMRAKGFKPDYEAEKASAWNIAIEQPLSDVRDVARVIELDNASIATSGDYRHMREFDDQIVSHAIDQNVAAPVINQVASVSVIAHECMLADAWATALMVMGEVNGIKFAKQHHMDALFILRNDQGFAEIGLGLFAKKDEA